MRTNTVNLTKIIPTKDVKLTLPEIKREINQLKANLLNQICCGKIDEVTIRQSMQEVIFSVERLFEINWPTSNSHLMHEILDRPLTSLRFSVRVLNCFFTMNKEITEERPYGHLFRKQLKEKGVTQIIYVKDLIRLSEKDLCWFANFGPKCLIEVKTVLSMYNLKLAN